MSKASCCWVWDALDCELKIAKTCDTTYAEQLFNATMEANDPFCPTYPYHSFECKFNPRANILIGGWVITILVSFLVSGAGGAVVSFFLSVPINNLIEFWPA